MDAGTREAITWTLGTLIAGFAILGVLVRLVLLPYLREHLIAPVKQVEKQVSENHHSNEPPTVLDRLDDVQQEVKVLGRMLEGHMEWSERWVKLIEREVDVARRDRGTPPPAGS
ncbi:hypothetical protein [Nocardioides soli]|uniref:Uncharacterized protein n=1 Tax=Nocardioides soli TaxID=1036020 RepID=A0A7W4VSZ7_9ACTN|nr:hypothetical protein [Nocardioides soli]MBB3041230.1 hypothetical protein [Nocardioides soli]